MAKNGFSMSNRVAVEEVTAGSTKTLTVDDCGKFFYIAQGTSVTTLNLPSLSDAENGWNITVAKTVSGSSSAAILIGASADDGASPMQGVRLSPSGAALFGDDLQITAVADAGTRVTLTKAGTAWVILGMCAADADIVIG